MKLLYIHDTPLNSYKANVIQVLYMCRAFAKLGTEVVLAVPDAGNDSVHVSDLIERKIGRETNFAVKSYRKISFFGKLSMVGGYPGVGQLLRTETPDYCFVRNPILINATIKQGIPTIFESHDAIIHDNYVWNLFWMHNLVKNCRRANLVKFIAISQRLGEEWIARGVPRDKVIILHDGVEADNFQTVPNVQKLREQLGFPVNKKIVAYIGSLYANRGIERILLLAKSFPQVLFVVIGGPKERALHYKRQAVDQQIDNILFLGPVLHAQVKNYLSTADVLLMVWSNKVRTINYCSPLKMFEYMAAGRIIVGQAFPTIQEVLKNGEHAYLADPESFDELREKMRLALSQTYPNVMAQKAHELVMNRYTWGARVKAIMMCLTNQSKDEPIKHALSV
jgi:glycosyltransferase involved in cell wall biosynthesis